VYKDADLYLLDAPFTHLDIATEKDIFEKYVYQQRAFQVAVVGVDELKCRFKFKTISCCFRHTQADCSELRLLHCSVTVSGNMFGVFLSSANGNFFSDKMQTEIFF